MASGAHLRSPQRKKEEFYMKLIFAVIRDKDANMAIEGLAQSHIGVTKLASTGGFLRDGNTTLMIGAENDQVDHVLEILKENYNNY